jgi:hypothetical protein
VTECPGRTSGRRPVTDEDAESADPALPAFLARPPGAPVYHGFPLIDGAEADGFRLGMITDLVSEPALEGNAYVIAPDGSRAGLVMSAIMPISWARAPLCSPFACDCGSDHGAVLVFHGELVVDMEPAADGGRPGPGPRVAAGFGVGLPVQADPAALP